MACDPVILLAGDNAAISSWHRLVHLGFPSKHRKAHPSDHNQGDVVAETATTAA
jgi:hypothetical protein